jgi:hypothetical protein
MEEELQQRIGANEDAFRKVNEAVASGQWPGEEENPVAFRCECGQLGCTRLIEIKPSAYERVRAHPKRFVLAPDHEIPETERVIERHAGYVVVEKDGEAGRVADATDPRS